MGSTASRILGAGLEQTSSVREVLLREVEDFFPPTRGMPVVEDFLELGDGGGAFLTRTAQPMPMVEDLLELACFIFNPLVEDFFLILKMSAMVGGLGVWLAFIVFSAFLAFLHREFGEGLGLFLVIFLVKKFN